MKSKPEESKLLTCEQCVFCETEDQRQVGCRADRLAKFKDANQAVKLDSGFYQIQRFCNFYRNDEWKHSKEKDNLKIAEKEAQLSFCIIVFDEEDDSLLERCVNGLMNIDYPPEKLKIILSSPRVSDVRKLVELTNRLTEKFKNSKLLISIQNEKSKIEYEAFSQNNNKSHFVKMNHNSVIPKNMLTEINDSLNNKLEKVVVFKCEDIIAMPFALVSSEYLKHGDFDIMGQAIVEQTKGTRLFKRINEK